ncbi:hypothetical protein Micbo1qcDRAFT_174996 [Microdochium bolleyi]|uniref:Uncharacterized protein n=1 Tax=Microdochium bolleyi TaxID=196109 RepID=A0A136J485_9PEZI|nr:hypothetical protein Micbo1qcDRAFT_174996 [Microdochium bolleyi]
MQGQFADNNSLQEDAGTRELQHAAAPNAEDKDEAQQAETAALQVPHRLLRSLTPDDTRIDVMHSGRIAFLLCTAVVVLIVWSCDGGGDGLTTLCSPRYTQFLRWTAHCGSPSQPLDNHRHELLPQYLVPKGSRSVTSEWLHGEDTLTGGTQRTLCTYESHVNPGGARSAIACPQFLPLDVPRLSRHTHASPGPQYISMLTRASHPTTTANMQSSRFQTIRAHFSAAGVRSSFRRHSSTSSASSRNSFLSSASSTSPSKTAVNAVLFRQPSIVDLEAERRSSGAALDMLEPRPIVYWGGVEERMGSL